MTRATAVLAAAGCALLPGGAGWPGAAGLPEGCRAAVTAFCADPSWPDPTGRPLPVRRLAARDAPAPPLPDQEPPAGE